MDSYIDPVSIKQDGDITRIQVLQNWKEPQKVGKNDVMQSTFVVYEFKCRQLLMRDVSFTGYAGPMQSGESWSGPGSQSWKYFTTTSVAGAVAEAVCK